jgi:tetratricopeptide (TPR) repeat protein
LRVGIEGAVTERILRIFVSSPSDVAGERARVKLVADRLNGELEGIVRLDILRWEDGFYTAAHSFQQAIDAAVGNMTATDMVLCIVWKRAGLKLNPAIWQRTDGTAYESGTVLEFETAVDVSRKQRGTPDVYLFRKTADVLYRADRANEEMEQYQLLQAVWKRWTQSAEGYNTAGYQSFQDADDFETKLEACLRQWLARRGVVAEGPVWDRALKGSPFRGLAAFEAAHAPVFFGREAAIARATAKLRQAPFLLLIGGSGSGKSSLLRAGLIPRITAPGVVPDIDLWRTAIIVPSGDPLVQLADALFANDALGAELRAGDFSDPQLLAELFAAGGKAALAPIRTALARAAQARKETLRYEAPRPARLLLAVDQVERLFVEVEPARVESFAGLLRALVEAELASVIAALRSDTYGRFQAVAPLLALLNERGATLDLLPPSPSELEDIVTRPVAACHPPLAYETDALGRSLAEVLAADARGGDALPLLQMTLQRLFEAEAARGDGVLRFADYPGMGAAVARTAEEAVAGLGPAARAALPNLLTAFVRDVTVDETGGLQSLVIVPVARSAFERGDPARAALIDEFVARRLLTTEEADGAARVRPVHEALLRVVPAAVAIIKENAALIRVRHTLEPMVTEWSRAGTATKGDFLATSPALIAGAAALNERMGDDLTPEMRAFIADSAAADARRREAERSRARRILMATAAGLVVALSLAALAGWQWQVAKTQRLRAEAALTAATRTANTLVFEMAQEFRDRGVPIDVLRKILDRARGLLMQLSSAGETSPDLLNSEAAALCELSQTLRDQGVLKEALEAAELCRAVMVKLTSSDPRNRQWQRQLAASYQTLGDVVRDSGRREEALEDYRQMLAIRETLATADPGNAGSQSDLVISYHRIGDLQAVAGQREAALDSYRRSLAISERLAAADPSLTDAQQGLSFSYNKVGDALVAGGQRDEALAAYRSGLAVMEKLAATDATNSRWQQGLGFSHEKMGNLLAQSGRSDDALIEYRKTLAIREKLAAADPGNAGWQRNLAASYSNVGDALRNANSNAEALENYRKAAAISDKLFTSDPSNAEWRQGFTVSQNKIGDMLAAAGQWEDALAAFRKVLTLREQLAKDDAGNADRQFDLAFSYGRVGAALAATGRREEALASFRNAVAIIEKLSTTDPGNVDWQHGLSVYYGQIGSTLLALNHPAEAVESYQKDLAIAQKLAAGDPGNGSLQRDLWISYNTLGDVLARANRPEEARTAYRTGLPVLDKLIAADPANVLMQTNLAGTLFKLAQAGDDAPARLRDGLAILRRLDAEGRLPADRKPWIGFFEQAIGNLPK